MSLRAWRSLLVVTFGTAMTCAGGTLLLCFVPRIVEW